MNILARIGCFVKIFSQKNRAINRTSQKRGKRDTFRLRCVSFLLFYKKIRLPIQSVKHKKLLSQYYFYIQKNAEVIFIIITDRYYRKININNYLRSKGMYMLDVFASVWRLHFMQKWRMEKSITLNMIKWICLTYESASKKIYCTRFVILLSSCSI